MHRSRDRSKASPEVPGDTVPWDIRQATQPSWGFGLVSIAIGTSPKLLECDNGWGKPLWRPHWVSSWPEEEPCKLQSSKEIVKIVGSSPYFFEYGLWCLHPTICNRWLVNLHVFIEWQYTYGIQQVAAGCIRWCSGLQQPGSMHITSFP